MNRVWKPHTCLNSPANRNENTSRYVMGSRTTTYLETTVGLNIEGLITLVDCFNRVDIMFGVVLGAVWFEKLKA